MKKKIVIITILISILVMGVSSILYFINYTEDMTRWALINEKGERITGYKFSGVCKYSENGLILVEDIFGNYGYIDCEGKYVIRPQFEEATEFENGYAYVTKNSFTLKGKKRSTDTLTKQERLSYPEKSHIKQNLQQMG